MGKIAGVEVRGMDLLHGRLLLLDPKRQQGVYQDALLRLARPIVRQAKAAAPHSGTTRRNQKGKKINLRDKIKAQKVKRLRGNEAGAVKIRTAQHAHLQEYGTKDRVQKGGRRTGSTPRRPFLEPAARANEQKVLDGLAAEVQRQIDRIVSRGIR